MTLKNVLRIQLYKPPNQLRYRTFLIFPQISLLHLGSFVMSVSCSPLFQAITGLSDFYQYKIALSHLNFHTNQITQYVPFIYSFFQFA